jgi:hypothetical protein
LVGKVDPSYVLSAGSFRGGLSLGTSKIMQNGTDVPLNISVSSGVNQSSSVLLWLSMSLSQSLQEYYTPSPWRVVATG